MVVGQEYTDFDKGLPEGIEGQIFGFNFILTSTVSRNKHFNQENYSKSPNFSKKRFAPFFKIRPKIDFKPFISHEEIGKNRRQTHSVTSNPLPHFATKPPHLIDVNVIGKSPAVTSTNKSDGLSFQYFKTPSTKSFVEPGRVRKRRSLHHKQLPYYFIQHNNIIWKDPVIPTPTVGRMLIEMTFNNCFVGRGSPLVGKAVLISWALTPVRVFGGAVIKPAHPICGKF